MKDDDPPPPPPDLDSDGIPDANDNCPAVANVDQGDLDGDLLGDACDPTPEGDPPPPAVCLCENFSDGFLSGWLTPEPDKMVCSFQDTLFNATTLTRWLGTAGSAPFRQAQATNYNGNNRCVFFDSSESGELMVTPLSSTEEVEACQNTLVTFFENNSSGTCVDND